MVQQSKSLVSTWEINGYELLYRESDDTIDVEDFLSKWNKNHQQHKTLSDFFSGARSQVFLSNLKAKGYLNEETMKFDDSKEGTGKMWISLFLFMKLVAEFDLSFKLFLMKLYVNSKLEAAS